VLASILLLLCGGAAVTAGGILFVLFGPIPINRRVTMVSRMQPMPMAAGSVAMAGMPIFDPAQASFSSSFNPAVSPSVPPVSVAPVSVAIEPSAPRRAKPPAPIVHPRGPHSGLAPLPRTRSARGTGSRAQQFNVEHTVPDGPVLEIDDPTFLEDDRA
jgi:hypothetical protein